MESIARSRGTDEKQSYDARELPDAILIARELLEYSKKQLPVGIFGDYDADGITSVAIWVEFFKEVGIPYEVYLPDRKDGYGASEIGLKSLFSKGIGALLFLDCGSSSGELLESIDIPIWIIDHHQVQKIPSKARVMNPYRTDVDVDPKYKEICTAGLSFMFIRSFAEMFSIGQKFVLSLADLACIGTIGDVMPLNPFNRECVKLGLELINNSSRISIASLCDVLKLGKQSFADEKRGSKGEEQVCTRGINYGKISFYIVPCINAAGRIMSATTALDWILSTSNSKKLSLTLHSLNLQRREMEKEILEELVVDASKEILFVKDDRLHPGMVGIVAGRLKEVHYKTCFVFYKSENLWKGSARSDSHDLGKLIAESIQLGLAEAGGGHKCAAGVSILESRFDEWKNWMLNRVKDELVLDREIEIDGFITELGLKNLQKLSSFGPFGPGNPSPRLILKSAWLRDTIQVGDHLRCVLQSGTSLFAFRCINSWGVELQKRVGKHIDMLLSVDELSVKIEDAMDSQ